MKRHNVLKYVMPFFKTIKPYIIKKGFYMVKEIIKERVPDTKPDNVILGGNQKFDLPIHLDRNGKPVLKLDTLLEGIQAVLSLTQFMDVNTGKFSDAKGREGMLGVSLHAKYRYPNFQNVPVICRADDVLCVTQCYGHHTTDNQLTGNGAIQQLFTANASRQAVMIECVATLTRCLIGFNPLSSANYFTLGLNERIIFYHTDLNVYFVGAATDTIVGTEWTA